MLTGIHVFQGLGIITSLKFDPPPNYNRNNLPVMIVQTVREERIKFHINRPESNEFIYQVAI